MTHRRKETAMYKHYIGKIYEKTDAETRNYENSNKEPVYSTENTTLDFSDLSQKIDKSEKEIEEIFKGIVQTYFKLQLVLGCLPHIVEFDSIRESIGNELSIMQKEKNLGSLLLHAYRKSGPEYKPNKQIEQTVSKIGELRTRTQKDQKKIEELQQDIISDSKNRSLKIDQLNRLIKSFSAKKNLIDLQLTKESLKILENITETEELETEIRKIFEFQKKSFLDQANFEREFHEIDFELLPSGQWQQGNKGEAMLKKSKAREDYDPKAFFSERIKFLMDLSPEYVYLQKSETSKAFSDYAVYEFKTVAILASPFLGNAIYIIDKDKWQQFLKNKTKRDLLTEGALRFLTVSKWQDRIREIVNDETFDLKKYSRAKKNKPDKYRWKETSKDEWKKNVRNYIFKNDPYASLAYHTGNKLMLKHILESYNREDLPSKAHQLSGSVFVPLNIAFPDLQLDENKFTSSNKINLNKEEKEDFVLRFIKENLEEPNQINKSKISSSESDTEDHLWSLACKIYDFTLPDKIRTYIKDLGYKKIDIFKKYFPFLENMLEIRFDTHKALEYYVVRVFRKEIPNFDNLDDLTKQQKIIGLFLNKYEASISKFINKNNQVHIQRVFNKKYEYDLSLLVSKIIPIESKWKEEFLALLKTNQKSNQTLEHRRLKLRGKVFLKNPELFNPQLDKTEAQAEIIKILFLLIEKSIQKNSDATLLLYQPASTYFTGLGKKGFHSLEDKFNHTFPEFSPWDQNFISNSFQEMKNEAIKNLE
ncbi:MAG: hypothetical protein GF347_03420 [Candidatus Moranbacteria bacterium]|nr:hypothetical protein [Candidatus Moranbacteria bacterium]